MSIPHRRKGRGGSSSLVLAASNVCELVLPLIRGIVLARLLPPEQFGLAISVVAVASTVELISDLGFAQMALRTGTTDTLGTLHALAIMRGAGLALAIAAAGPLFALAFNAPGTAWVYSLVGLTSFIRSLSHLEPKIRMREYRYTPEAMSVIGGQLIWTAVSVGTAILLHDYRAMAIGLITYAIGVAAISHLCSSTRYRLAWDREMVAEAFRYGRPLTLNGVALAVTGLGDRFLTGSRIGLEQLAQYTALSTAAFTPRSVLIRFAISLFVPHFVNATTDAERRRLADVWIILMTALGSMFGFCYIAFGQAVVALAFGKHYIVEQDSVTLIAVLACIRYMATIPVAPSMANGRTSFVLLNTTLAASGLVLAAILLCFYPNLQVMVLAMALGEGFGFLFVLNRLRRSIPMDILIMWIAVLLPLTLLVFVGMLVALFPSSSSTMRYSLCGAGLLIEAGCTTMLIRRSGSSISDIWHILLPERTESTPESATVSTV